MAESWLPTGRVRRAITPARLIAEGAALAAVAKARALRGGDAKDIAAELANDEKLTGAALRMARQLGEMKGAAMKIGQVLSFIDLGVVPEQFRGALAALQADAPPMPYAMVEEVVEAELGARPEVLFDYFSPVPIASASIGQVHMAHRGEEELVVKVQYPGVAKAIESDLRNAALLALLSRVLQRLMADMLGKVDTSALIDELRDRITEELDYRIEAANQQLFADLWRDDPHIDVPDVVPELSTRRVITSAYVDGLRWSAAVEQPQELRDKWGTAMARFQLVSLFSKGVTNLDPHPGNYLFHDDGHVTFLDYGACQRFSEDQVLRLGGLAIAGIADTEEEVLDALVRMGLLRHTHGIDPELVVRPIRLAMEPATTEPQPFAFQPDFVAKQVWQALDFRIGRDKIRMLRALDVPPEVPMILRIVLGIAGILSQLGSTVHFQDVLDEAFAGHPDYTPFAGKDGGRRAG